MAVSGGVDTAGVAGAQKVNVRTIEKRKLYQDSGHFSQEDAVRWFSHREITQATGDYRLLSHLVTRGRFAQPCRSQQTCTNSWRPWAAEVAASILLVSPTILPQRACHELTGSLEAVRPLLILGRHNHNHIFFKHGKKDDRHSIRMNAVFL